MKPLFLSLILLCNCIVGAMAHEPSIKIAPYKGNKSAAVSYTLDDGLDNQYLLAAPIMEKVGINGTFFIATGIITDNKTNPNPSNKGKWETMCWSQVKELSDRGFEIASHGVTHRNLMTDIKNVKELRWEIEESANTILDKTGLRPVSMCYPYNAFDETIQQITYDTYAVDRTFQRGVGVNDKNADGLNKWVDYLISDKQWGVAMIHGFIDGFDPLSPEVFEEHLKYTKTKEKDIWIDTFGNVGRYLKEYNVAEIEIVEQTKDSVTFCIHTGLDTELFNEPLTVIINDALMVDCIPDSNPITVSLQ